MVMPEIEFDSVSFFIGFFLGIGIGYLLTKKLAKLGSGIVFLFISLFFASAIFAATFLISWYWYSGELPTVELLFPPISSDYAPFFSDTLNISINLSSSFLMSLMVASQELKITSQELKIAQLQKELEKEKNRSWWSKLWK